MLLSLSIIGFSVFNFHFYNYKNVIVIFSRIVLFNLKSLCFYPIRSFVFRIKMANCSLYLNFAFLSYLAGPFLFFYVRGFKTGLSKIKKRDYWHFTFGNNFNCNNKSYIFTMATKNGNCGSNFIRQKFYMEK